MKNIIAAVGIAFTFMIGALVIAGDKSDEKQLLEMRDKLDDQTREMWKQLKAGDLTNEQIQNFIECHSLFSKKEDKNLAALFAYDMGVYHWKLTEDVSFSGAFTPELVDFRGPNEPYIAGETVRQRAKVLDANLGQRHAEYLLEHQELIPKEWQGKHLIFPGTVWRDLGGGYSVPCLEWIAGRWHMSWLWLDLDWGVGDRLVHSCQ